MGRRDYPALRDSAGFKGNKADGICDACTKPATAYIRIAWDYMRGNDDTFIVCQKHLRMANKQLSRCLAHIGTKDKYVAGEFRKPKEEIDENHGR